MFDLHCRVLPLSVDLSAVQRGFVKLFPVLQQLGMHSLSERIRHHCFGRVPSHAGIFGKQRSYRRTGLTILQKYIRQRVGSQTCPVGIRQICSLRKY